MADLPAPQRHFASDNWAGVHPEVLAAISAANVGHTPSYGDDPWTARAVERFRSMLGAEIGVYFVFTGSAANVLGLGSVLRPYQAVICASTAHLNVDECGGYERFAGGKLLPVATTDGKLTPSMIETQLGRAGDVHSVQPAAVSITQSTEYGTVYSLAEIRTLSAMAHSHGLLLHMDGSRVANAAASLGIPIRAFTTDAGVDILSFGGTKNGLLGGEAVIFTNGARAADFEFVRKQGMQLASKMRFTAAQFDALLTGDLWLRSATHANRMAQRLHERVRGIPGVAVTQRVEANVVFARLPRATIAPLQSRFRFLVWHEPSCEVRWMTSFDTTSADVDAFADAITEIVGRSGDRA